MRILTLLILFASAWRELPAQVLTALEAPATAAEPFTTVTGLHELPDGRVLVTDSRERAVRLVDFVRGTSVGVAREGSGPREYRAAGRLFAWAGDSTAMYDAELTRVLVLNASGSPARSFQLADALAFASNRPSRGDVRFIDRSGRVYAQSAAIPEVAPGQPPPDSAPVVRFDPGRRQVDTIARVRLSGLAQRPGANGFSINIGAIANPFRTQDAWAGFPDGRVALVRSVPYSVEWLDVSLRHVRGPAVGTPPVPVTAADRAAIQRAGVSLGGRPIPVRAELLTDLPETKPAFDHRTLVADPVMGTIWIQRFRPATDSIPVYDVFDSAGRLTSRVRVPPRSRVVGFGRVHVYTARTDDDDLHWLERFRRP